MSTTLYVDASAPGGVHDGSSWETAYLDLQQALTAAVSGDQIRVADGIYKPTATPDPGISFVLKTGVSVLGGYAGNGAPNPNERDVALHPTLLSGDIGTAGAPGDNSIHVVIGSGTDATAVLDGFTITAGQGGNAHGAGMYNDGGSPTVNQCIFSNNNTTRYGGGMYNVNGSSPTVTNCAFTSNSARDGGAGMANVNSSSPIVTDCTFTSNLSVAGSGIGLGRGGGIMTINSSNAVITRCTFTANGGGGGGAYNLDSSPSFTDCIFTRNTFAGFSNFGGALRSTGGAPTVLRCVFEGNSTQSYGGAIYSDSMTVINSIFVANRVQIVDTGNGGAVYGAGGGVSLINCTLAANMAASGAAVDGTVSRFNSVSWGNVSPVNPGNDLQNPQFVRNPSPGADGSWGTADDDFGDLHLRAYSPAVDAGDNGDVPIGVTTDLDGGPRFRDVLGTPDIGSGTPPMVDRGAYETIGALVASAGEPYAVLTGQNIVLEGLGTSDDSSLLQFEWEWTGDGLFNDGVGPSPLFNSGALPIGTRTVSLRLTDGLGHSVTSSTTLTILSQVVYVDSRATGGANNGSNWNNAFTSLAQALALAPAGTLIKVGAGTYKPDDSSRIATFGLKSGVSIYGGYAGFGAANPESRNIGLYVSTLSGSIGSPNTQTDDILHVVSAGGTDSSALLDGFTISGGYANGIAFAGYGGGILNLAGSPTIANCTLIGNTANVGGAIANLSGTMSISGSAFTANAARAFVAGVNAFGGAIYNNASATTLTNCTFTANSAVTSGGGVGNWSESTISMVGCTFKGNTSRAGGGFYNSDSVATLTGCNFIANSAVGSNGGGIYTQPSSGLVQVMTLTKCVFTGNSSTMSGGGIYDVGQIDQITNCVFVGNIAALDGGGIYINAVPPNIINCTITSNIAGRRGGGVSVFALSGEAKLMNNSIVWGNSAPTSPGIYTGGSAALEVSYSDIQDGYTGTGNVDADPQFFRNPSPGLDSTWGTADDDYGDLRLRISSVGIDSADNTAIPAGVTTDHAGNDRIGNVPGVRDPGAIVDMGAYERIAPFADLQFIVDAPRPSIRATFNVDALAGSISPADLVLVNLTTGQVIDCATSSTVSYDAGTRTATWAFLILLPDGNYRATLPAGTVLDPLSAPLFIADVTHDFFSLAGDANRDRKVDVVDLGILSMNWMGSGKIFGQGDFNYDGTVNALDLGILSGNWQKTQPPAPAAPALPASIVNRTPSRGATRVAAMVL